MLLQLGVTMRWLASLIVAVVLSFFSPSVPAAIAAPYTLSISATASDTVGRQLLFHFREEVRRSRSFLLRERYGDGVIVIRIVTLDPDARTSTSGNRTVYSFVVTVLNSSGDDYYLHNIVWTCGLQRTRDCATGLLGDVDLAVADLMKDAPSRNNPETPL